MHDLVAALSAKSSGDGWIAKCPGHDDHRASLSIGRGDDGRWLLKCHAGCALDGILAAAGLESHDLFPAKTRTIVATYPYHDEGGAHLYDVVRFDPKDFRQRRADGTWKMAGVRRVLYRLRELQGQMVAYVVEGEKDADRLRAIGLPGTTAPGGAGKWRPAYIEQLKAAGVEHVVVVPDHDEPGLKHANDVAASCQAAGLKVKIVELPDLPTKGDVSDWLDAGHARNELVGLVKATPLYEPMTAETAPAASEPSEAIDLAVLLNDLETFIRRYVVLSSEQAVAIALWVVHTHVIAAADCTPYLQITSATKRTGKTRLLEVLEPLVARPWLTGRTSAAALTRKIDGQQPTLLLDESDAAFRGEKEYAEALRGILDSGYRRSGRATSCVGQGANITAKDYATFCAKAIAGIGALPDTVGDRAIPIVLKRRTPREPCARWRERNGHAEAAPLHEQFVIWAGREPIIEMLRSARPTLPDALGDRAMDVWEPLLAIADLAAGELPARARKAAVALAGALEDQDFVVELLYDIADILNEYTDTVIPTKDLLAKLVEREDRPWATWRKDDKPITGRGLARLLGPLGIHPTHLERIRGYRRDAFDDAVARYLPLQASLRHNPNETGLEPAISMCQDGSTDDTCKTAKQADVHCSNDAMTHRSGDTRDVALPDADRDVDAEEEERLLGIEERRQEWLTIQAENQDEPTEETADELDHF